MTRDTWVWIGVAAGAAALLYYAESQGLLPPAAQATPLSIYPSFAWTAQAVTTTSMAATGQQHASTAVIVPTPLFSSVQQAEQSAILTQCVGANVCSPLTGDTQLGL